jgi:hypothetical protein
MVAFPARVSQKNSHFNLLNLETKGICLMVADVDESLIEKHDAQLLAYYAQYFHTEQKGMTLGKLLLQSVIIFLYWSRKADSKKQPRRQIF